MSFTFDFPFPVIPNGAPVKFSRPRASTPGPINTDLSSQESKDLIVWTGAGTKLQSIAAGALKYVPASSTGMPGALAIITKHVPWPWTTMVNESQYLVKEIIPTVIYYENVDRSTLEIAIKNIIKTKYKNEPPSPENIMLDGFFAGEWVGKTAVLPNGDNVIEPLTVTNRTELGFMRVSSILPPLQADTPNAVIIKIRKPDETTAIDVANIAFEAAKQCKADSGWLPLFEDMYLSSPFPINTETIVGQQILHLDLYKIYIDILKDLLQSDLEIFNRDPQSTADYRAGINNILTHLSNAYSFWNVVNTQLLTNPYDPPDSLTIDLESLFYRLELIHAYRYLLHHHLFVYFRWIQTSDPLLGSWLTDVNNLMSDINQILANIAANPSQFDRTLIHNKLQGAAQSVNNLRVTPEQLAMLNQYQTVIGAVSLTIATVSLAAASYRALQNFANIFRGTGGNFAAASVTNGSVAFENALIYELSAAEINALAGYGLLSGGISTLILMSSQGNNFNPHGKDITAARRWVKKYNPQWKEIDPFDAPGSVFQDENGVPRIRLMRPRKSEGYNKPIKNYAPRKNIGYWRKQSPNRYLENAEGEVAVFRKNDGTMWAHNDQAGTGKITKKQVFEDPAKPKHLTSGEKFRIYDSEGLIHEATHIDYSFAR